MKWLVVEKLPGGYTNVAGSSLRLPDGAVKKVGGVDVVLVREIDSRGDLRLVEALSFSLQAWVSPDQLWDEGLEVPA